MSFLFYSVVRRYMKKTGRYFTPPEPIPREVEGVVQPQETLVGWYRNPDPYSHYLLVFSNEAIYSVENGKVTRIGVDDVIDYESPESKVNAQGLWVQHKSGRDFLRACGSFGRTGTFQDAFSLGMVMLAISRRNARRESPGSE